MAFFRRASSPATPAKKSARTRSSNRSAVGAGREVACPRNAANVRMKLRIICIRAPFITQRKSACGREREPSDERQEFPDEGLREACRRLAQSLRSITAPAIADLETFCGDRFDFRGNPRGMLHA